MAVCMEGPVDVMNGRGEPDACIGPDGLTAEPPQAVTGRAVQAERIASANEKGCNVHT